MKTFDGFLKRKLGDTNVLLAGGDHKALSAFIGSITYDSSTRKIQYTPVGGNAVDLVTFGTLAFDSTSYLPSTYDDYFFRYRGTMDTNYVDLTTYSNDAENYQNPKNGIWLFSRPGHYASLITFTSSGGSASGLDIYFDYSRGSDFKIRRRVDSKRLSGDWEKILTDVNYTDCVKNGTLSLQASGTTKISFSANLSSNATFNISTGSENGTISVGGTDVAVKGLGSRAYDSTSYLPLTGGTLEANNSWLSPARLQLLRPSNTVYTDRACIGVTDGNLHIDAYPNKGLYLNHYSSGGAIYFNGGKYYIKGGNYNGNSASSTKWANARTLTIGNTGKSVNGTADVSWSLSEIGALPVGNYIQGKSYSIPAGETKILSLVSPGCLIIGTKSNGGDYFAYLVLGYGETTVRTLVRVLYLSSNTRCGVVNGSHGAKIWIQNKNTGSNASFYVIGGCPSIYDWNSEEIPASDLVLTNTVEYSLNGHNHNSSYVSAVVISGNYLRVTKNDSNSDLTIPYATSAGTLEGKSYNDIILSNGKNLIRSYAKESSSSSYLVWTSHVLTETVALGERLTITIEYSLSSNATKTWLNAYTGGGYASIASFTATPGLDHHVESKTFTITYASGHNDNAICLYYGDSNKTGTCIIHRVKVERGWHFTGWSPAPEDIMDIYSTLTIAGTKTFNSTISGSINGNAATADKWKTKRSITIGSTSKDLDGSGNVTWSLADIGAATSGHTHDYLPLSGGTVTGSIEISTGSTNNNYNEGLRITRANNNWAGITFGSTGRSGAPTNGWFAALNPLGQFIITPDSSVNTTGLTLTKGGDLKWRNTVVSLAGHTHNYLPLTGGQMTGPLTWEGFTALPEQTSPLYFVVVDAFASGGTTKFSSVASVKTALGLGSNAYTSTAYLPLTGGTMTGTLNMTCNTVEMNFRTGHDKYNSKMEYMTYGNEAMVWANQNAVTSFIFKCGLDLSDESNWTGITPSMQIKNQSVYINSLIADGTTPSYNLYVNGSANVTGDTTAANFFSSSDINKKENIKRICPILPLYSFNWKESKEKSYGFIALYLEDLGYTELVNGEEGNKSVNYSAALSWAMAVLSNVVDDLRSRIILLENKLSKYEDL